MCSCRRTRRSPWSRIASVWLATLLTVATTLPAGSAVAEEDPSTLSELSKLSTPSSTVPEALSTLTCFLTPDPTLDGPSTPEELASWQEEQLEAALDKGATTGNLGHHAGGPWGAEWNPWGDLFCVASFPLLPPPESPPEGPPQALDIPSTSGSPLPKGAPSEQTVAKDVGILPSVALTLGGKPAKDILISHLTKRGRSLVTFTIPMKTWDKAAKPMVEADLPWVYVDEPDAIEAWTTYKKTGDEAIVGIPPIVGWVFRIVVTLGTGTKATKAEGVFHFATGE